MQSNQLTSVLNSDENLSDFSLSQLQQLQDRYPYAASLAMLSCRKAHLLAASGDLPDLLAAAAIRSPSRSKLKSYVLSPSLTDSVVSSEEVEKTETEFIAGPTEASAIVPDGRMEEIIPSTEESKQESEVELDSQYVAAAYSAKLEQELEDFAQFDISDQLKRMQEHRHSALESEAQSTVQEESSEIDTAELDELETENTVSDTEFKSFSAWIKTTSQTGVLTIPKASEKDKDENTDIDEAPFENEVLDTPKTSTEQIASKELDKTEVIERAERSVSLNESVYTETLAEIFEQQEKYDRAIEIYTKLSLKLPQKRANFAAKIALLQEKLK